MIDTIVHWIDERTGVPTAIRDFLTEDVPGGASYWYVFGSATLIAFVIQVLTGILLTFYYSPGSSTAWASTYFIYTKVIAGQFLISLHSWGASAMIVLMTLHLLQVLLWGAYKKPRELQWVVGVLLFFLVLSMGLTGYLLPWDLNAYFATQVAINIAGNVPVIGTALQYFAYDGSTMGALTLTRFYGIHVWLTPIALFGLIGLHLFILRHNQPAGPPTDVAPVKVGRFFPDQVFYDTVASTISFAIVVALAIFMPTPLLAKADPNNAQFIPSPAWYFYSLYGILRLTPANLILVGTVIVPGVFATLLILLPWLDRNPSRVLKRRPFLLSFTVLTVAVVVGMSIYAAKAIADEQAKSPTGQTPVAGFGAPPNAADLVARQLYAQTPGGTAPAAENAAESVDGATIFKNNCASCHGANGAGTPGTFPPLAANPYVTGPTKPLADTLLNGMHGAVVIKGQTYNGLMPAWKDKLSDDEIAAVLTYIRSSWGNKASAVKASDITPLRK